MKTWFENAIHKRPLYSGNAYVFTARTDCIENSIEYSVYNPFKSPSKKYFKKYKEAEKYYLSLGN